MNEQHEGKRKNEALWPVFQITWQRSRYVYDMHYVYKAITKDVLEYCIRSVSAEGAWLLFQYEAHSGMSHCSSMIAWG